MSSPSEIQFQELKPQVEAGQVLVLDVRGHDEREDGRIPGSVCVPIDDIPDAFLLPEHEFQAKYNFEKPAAADSSRIVVSCHRGRRAEAAIGKLKPLQYTQLKLYKGGFSDWEAKGGPIEKDESQ